MASDPRVALAGRDVRPVIARPRSGLSGPMLAVIGAVLALALFLVLDARRRAMTDADNSPRTTADAFVASPPPLAVPPPPVAVPIAVVVKSSPPPPAVAPPQPHFAPPPPAYARPSPPIAPVTDTIGPRGPDRADAPVLVVDATVGSSASVATASKDQPGQAAGDSDDAVRATVIRGRSSLIPQGTLIAAVLETPLNSDRPGLARAVVARDARSFDGSRVLIPKGSRLIGEFHADSNAAQHRVLVTWTRLIRPDGVAIRIGSPAADALGGAGIPGKVNTHFFERFANAVLQSALTIAVNRASQSGNGSLYLGLPNQVGNVSQQLLPSVTPRTTVKVRQGAEISIFVARDLDFGGTPAVR